MSEKLQKVLARCGLGARREMERWIADRRVSVNGKIVDVGIRVEENDKIRVDGRLLTWRPAEEFKPKVIIYNKPEGEVCTRSDPEKRPTVFEALPPLRNGRWINVGRLDCNTQGLLLFTNHGDLAHKLMHPSSNIEREYAVRVFGEVTPAILKKLREGVTLDDGKASFTSISHRGGEGMNHWYHVVLMEGRNREVRRLWESQDVRVSRLIRVRFGELALPKSLHRGQWRYLNHNEIKLLEPKPVVTPKS